MLSGCTPQSEENSETVQVLDHADVVMDGESLPPAEAAADPTAPPPPGGAPPEGLTEAKSGLTDEEMMAKMTPAEKAAFQEEMKSIWDSAEGEAQSNAVLIGDIQQAVEDYHTDKLKLPANLAELLQEGYLEYLPKLPAGKKLKIDGKTLAVTLE